MAAAAEGLHQNIIIADKCRSVVAAWYLLLLLLLVLMVAEGMLLSVLLL
jgi:hypothetical protein